MGAKKEDYSIDVIKEHKSVYIMLESAPDKEKESKIEKLVEDINLKNIIFDLTHLNLLQRGLFKSNLEMFLRLAKQTEKKKGKFVILVKNKTLKTSISKYNNNELRDYCEEKNLNSYLRSYHKAQG